MKKTIVWLLCGLMLLCVACSGKPETGSEKTAEPVAEQPTETPEENPEPTPGSIVDTPTAEPTDVPENPATDEPTEEPTPAYDTTGLPMVYNLYEEVGFSVSEAEMFRYDIDFDGREEVISFRLDEDEDTTTILIDDQEVRFDFSSILSQVVLIDLDPETPYVNLLVEIDWGSDDYVTTELHLENDVPVKGVETGEIRIDEEGQVIVYQRCEFLGTRFLGAVAQGESLKADFSDWYDCYHPSDEEIREDFELLVEFGDLLHATRDIPCTINGKNAKIAKDSYVYLLRINPSEHLAEVCTIDGKVAVITYTIGEDDWPYMIDGVAQDDCFDNILHAD
jgi:hypothetical protein